jgi:hypothetical protein
MLNSNSSNGMGCCGPANLPALQVTEEDDLRFSSQPLDQAAAEPDADPSPFEQQQQPGHEGTSLQVEAESSSADLELCTGHDEADAAGFSLVALPR